MTCVKLLELVGKKISLEGGNEWGRRMKFVCHSITRVTSLCLSVDMVSYSCESSQNCLERCMTIYDSI